MSGSTSFGQRLCWLVSRLPNNRAAHRDLMPNIFSRLMRKTGKLYHLTLASAGMSVGACFLVSRWSEDTLAYHFWLDIVPQGFGMSSLITSTLIVRIVLVQRRACPHAAWYLQAMIATVSKEDMAVATGSECCYKFRYSLANEG